MKNHLLLCALATILACRPQSRKVTPAFYFWKSQFSPTSFEKQRLDSLGVQLLYIKLFDVARDPFSGAALPVAKLSVRDTTFLKSKKIIPTVFITNEVFYQSDSAATKALAANVAGLVHKYCLLYGLKNIPELQIDCDWTATTKNQYFYFLEQVKALHVAPALSATIRLHQVKYTTSSGIPPVDKGLLMCYNMGNLQDLNTSNSVLDVEAFKKYQSGIKTYPLPLDVGLPLFEWYVLFRNDQYAGLISSIPDSILRRFGIKGSNWYEVKETVLVRDRLLQPGDLLRHERSKTVDVEKVAALVNKKLSAPKINVALYHCDSVILSKYNIHDLESFYSGLRRY